MDAWIIDLYGGLNGWIVADRLVRRRCDQTESHRVVRFGRYTIARLEIPGGPYVGRRHRQDEACEERHDTDAGHRSVAGPFTISVTSNAWRSRPASIR